MELGPIIRALMHNKVRFWLIAIEVALTLAIAINAGAMLFELRDKYNQPSGMDDTNLLTVSTLPFGERFKSDSFVDSTREEDLRRLRAFPGVRDATVIDLFPLSGSGTIYGRRPLGAKSEDVTTPVIVVGRRALPTLGVELTAGRSFGEGDFVDDDVLSEQQLNRNVLVTRELADELFPQGDALGQVIEGQNEPIKNTIVGIVGLMQNGWPHSAIGKRVMLIPGEPGDYNGMRYLVRAEPGSIDALYGQLENLLFEINPERIVKIQTLLESKDRVFNNSLLMVKLLSGIIGMLVVVTILGIVGLTSFSVAERTRQIGTRRALGATRADILRYFLVESWTIAGAGLVLGSGLAYLVNYALAQVADAPRLELGALAVVGLALWITSMLAALVPALRAMTISPDLATRS